MPYPESLLTPASYSVNKFVRVAGYVANATIIIDGLGTAVGVYGLEAACQCCGIRQGTLIVDAILPCAIT
jgi:hypothetical protein